MRVLLVFICLLQSCLMIHAFPIAKDGEALAVVVTGKDPTPVEQTAAKELQTHLQRMTGATFDIVAEDAAAAGRPRIIVGHADLARARLGADSLTTLGPEEFIVQTVDQDLLLVGGRPRGTLYAVYSFLEDDLGCRWMTWYDDVSIPERRDLAVPELDRRESPAMATRDMVIHPNRVCDRDQVRRFLVRNRCQGPDLHFTGDLTAVGGASHRFRYPPNGWLVHTLFQWLPPDIHFGVHPEWYSFGGGRRVSRRQLCFSDPGLRSTLTQTIIEHIGRTDASGLYSVSAMDWTGAFCDCADCQSLIEREATPGAPLFDYLAELGEAVQATYPQAWISTLAYRKEQSEIPPKTIRLPDNVIVIFAPIDANFAAPLNDASNADTLQNLRRWPNAAKHLWVWYYPNTYGPALPMGNLRRLAEDFRIFREVGVEGYYVEHDAPGIYDSRRVADLQSWLNTKLMWNPDRDLQAMIDDYLQRHYGKAAPAVQAYLRNLEKATAAQSSPMSWNANAGQHHFLTAEFLLSAQRLLDEALSHANGAPEVERRVRQLRMSVDLACILRWNELSRSGTVPFTRERLVDRYCGTYSETVKARNLASMHAALLDRLQESMKWYSLMTPLKALPTPLEDVPGERVRQFTPESARLHGEGPEIVTDPHAAAGIAACMTPSLKKPSYAPADLPDNALNFGFYDASSRRQQHAYAGKDEPIAAGDYQLYSIGRTALSPNCYVWFDWSWRIQFQNVAALYDPAHPDRQWDVYVSVRVEGPAYEARAAAQENRFYVDRVIFVAVE